MGRILTDVGERKVTVTVSSTNYNNVTAEFTLKVTPKELRVKAIPLTRKYDAAKDYVAVVYKTLGVIEADRRDVTLELSPVWTPTSHWTTTMLAPMK